MNSNKNFLREKFKSLKRDITEDKKIFLDKNIRQNILNLSEYLESNIILAYMANQIEINIDDIILRSINNNKKVAVPKCLDLNGELNIEPKMNFYFINSLSDVYIGKFNIREPAVLKNNLVDEYNISNQKVVMLLPGLVFDKRGYRVGYGKGYYDRYLSQVRFKILKIGLCYDFCSVDRITTDETDIPVDILVTQTKVIRLN